MANELENATEKLQKAPASTRRVLLIVLAIVLMLGTVATVLASRYQARATRQLLNEQRHKLTLVVTDSIARSLYARHQARVDSLRTFYERQMDAQAARYEHQKRQDADLERRYRATGPLDLPDYGSH